MAVKNIQQSDDANIINLHRMFGLHHLINQGPFDAVVQMRALKLHNIL